MSLEIVVSNGPELTSEALTWPDQARAIRIIDNVRYVAAGDMLKGIKALRQRIAETFDPHIKRANEAHRALCRGKQEAEAPLLEAELIIKRGLVAFDDAQERIRREEERRRQEEAQKEEEARRVAEAAALETEALQTGDASLLDQAMELIDMPAPVAIIAPVEKQTPKVAGVSYRENWRFRITDATRIPREYLKVDEVKLGAVIRAMKGAATIPGVEVYAEKAVAAGAR